MARYATSLERAKRSTELEHDFRQKVFLQRSERLLQAQEEVKREAARREEEARQEQEREQPTREQLMELMDRLEDRMGDDFVEGGVKMGGRVEEDERWKEKGRGRKENGGQNGGKQMKKGQIEGQDIGGGGGSGRVHRRSKGDPGARGNTPREHGTPSERADVTSPMRKRSSGESGTPWRRVSRGDAPDTPRPPPSSESPAPSHSSTSDLSSARPRKVGVYGTSPTSSPRKSTPVRKMSSGLSASSTATSGSGLPTGSRIPPPLSRRTSLASFASAATAPAVVEDDAAGRAANKRSRSTGDVPDPAGLQRPQRKVSQHHVTPATRGSSQHQLLTRRNSQAELLFRRNSQAEFLSRKNSQAELLSRKNSQAEQLQSRRRESLSQLLSGRDSQVNMLSGGDSQGALASGPESALARRASQQSLDVGDLKRLTRRLSIKTTDYITDPELMVGEERKVYEFLRKPHPGSGHADDARGRPQWQSVPKQTQPLVYTESAEKQLSHLFGADLLNDLQDTTQGQAPASRSDGLLQRLLQTPISLPPVHMTRGTTLRTRDWDEEVAQQKRATPTYQQWDNLRYCRYLRMPGAFFDTGEDGESVVSLEDEGDRPPSRRQSRGDRPRRDSHTNRRPSRTSPASVAECDVTYDVTTDLYEEQPSRVTPVSRGTDDTD